MKRILAGTFGCILVGFLTMSVQATNPIWFNTTGDNLWDNASNWGANPVNATDIFNGSSPAGDIYFSANFTCARLAARSGAPPRYVTIYSNALTDVTFTISGAAAETIDAAAAPSGNDWTFDGAANGNGARLSMQLNNYNDINISGGTTFNMNLAVYGNGGIIMGGPGTLVLAGSNTFAGDVTIQGGVLRLAHPQGLASGARSLGTAVPGTSISATGTLDLGGQADVNEVITLNGTGFPAAGGALINSSNTVASLAGDKLASISVSAGGQEFSYPTTVDITGGGGSGAAATALLGLTDASITLTNGGINYSTPPTVSFSGGGGSGAQATAQIDTDGLSPTFTQVTNIVVTNPGSGYTSAPTVTLFGGGGTDAGAEANASFFTVVGTIVTSPGSGYTSPPAIDFTGGDGGLASATANLGSVILGTGAAATVGGSGPITINSVVSGDGSLTKNGEGTLTLARPNTYTGGTIINAGTLLANGNGATGPGAVTVNGGTLGGTGPVLGAVTGNTGGSVGAGASAGILTLAGGLNLSGGGSNVWQLAALKDDSDGTAGTDFDQLAVTGGELDLSGNSQLVLQFIDAATAPYSTTAFWQASHTWTIVTISGSGANTTNLPFANIANGTYNAGSFSNYVGAAGKIMLTYTPNAASGPVITSQPQSVTTNQNRAVTFDVAATGTDPLYYHWYFQSESNLLAAGEGVTSYSIPSVQPVDQGDYFVIITNSLGSKTSDVAVLTVVVTPAPTIQPLVGAGTTNVTLSWDTVPGAIYELQYSTDLAVSNWTVITNLVATGSSVTVQDYPPADDPQRYYRVIAQ